MRTLNRGSNKTPFQRPSSTLSPSLTTSRCLLPAVLGLWMFLSTVALPMLLSTLELHKFSWQHSRMVWRGVPSRAHSLSFRLSAALAWTCLWWISFILSWAELNCWVAPLTVRLSLLSSSWSPDASTVFRSTTSCLITGRPISWTCIVLSRIRYSNLHFAKRLIKVCKNKSNNMAYGRLCPYSISLFTKKSHLYYLALYQLIWKGTKKTNINDTLVSARYWLACSKNVKQKRTKYRYVCSRIVSVRFPKNISKHSNEWMEKN